MDPATPDELDHLIRQLLEDDGPPLMVTFRDGHTWRAGSRTPEPDRVLAQARQLLRAKIMNDHLVTERELRTLEAIEDLGQTLRPQEHAQALDMDT